MALLLVLWGFCPGILSRLYKVSILMGTREMSPNGTPFPSSASPSGCLSRFSLKVLRNVHTLQWFLNLPRLEQVTALPSSIPLGKLLGFSELHPESRDNSNLLLGSS